MPANIKQPRHLLVLGGKGPGKDGIERDVAGRKIPNDPGFRRIPPDKPTSMSEFASQMWDKVVPEMTRIGILKEGDEGALVMMCEAFSRWQEARNIRIKESVLGETLNGGQIRHPATLVEESAAKEYRAWCHEFGLTPSAEMNLRVPESKGAAEQDPFG